MTINMSVLIFLGFNYFNNASQADVMNDNNSPLCLSVHY